MIRKKLFGFLTIILFFLVYQNNAWCVKLPTVNITAPLQSPVNAYSNSIYNTTSDEYSLTPSGINLFSGPAQKSPFFAISMLPSVNVNNADILGDQSTLRFRGISPMSRPGSPIDVEGLPTPGGPKFSSNIFDMENIENIKVYEGAIPANKALGMANLPGMIDMKIKKPMDKFNVSVSQTAGSNSLSRTFLRIDTGSIDGWKAFASSSYAYADKWKGKGNEINRNLMLGINKNFSNVLNLEIYTGYNQDNYHQYMPLTYAQATNLNKYYYDDYTNNPDSANYYDYNRTNLKYYYILSKLSFKPLEGTQFIFKPYYWHISGYEMGSGLMVPPNYVGKWFMDNDNYGAVSEYKQKLTKDLKLTLGYFYHKEGRPGPPNDIEKYAVINNQPVYQGMAFKSNNGHNTISSPYVTLDGTISNLNFDIGGRYLKYTVGSTTAYNSNNTIDPKASASSMIFTRFLPYIGLNYNLSQYVNVFANYGKTYNLNLNLFPAFVNNKSKFENAGYSLQDIENKYLKLDVAENFDFGIKYNNNHWYVYPTFFYSNLSNKQAIVDIPNVGPFVADTAQAKSYGTEIAAGYSPFSDFLVFASYSYNRFYYTNNVNIMGKTYNISGNQVIDAPKNMVKGGFTYKTPVGISFTPLVVYTGERYGDILHTQRIPSSTIVNLNIDYNKKNLGSFKDFKIGLEFINLFNRHYISMINGFDSSAITGGASYYAGMPFTVATTISTRF